MARTNDGGYRVRWELWGFSMSGRSHVPPCRAGCSFPMEWALVLYLCVSDLAELCVFHVVRKVSSTVFVRIGKPSWHEETFVIQLNYPQSFHKIRISSAFLSQPVCLGTPMRCIGKKEFFLTLNSQLFCGKFCSCDQKLDDLVSRTATK